MITLGVEGIASLGLSLTRKARLRRRIVEHLAEVAEPVADEIREAAPEESGALRESVRVEQDSRKLQVSIKAGGVPETERPSSNGVTYDEALLTEYGTVKQAPRPFFWPAIRAHEDDFERAGTDAVASAMED